MAALVLGFPCVVSVGSIEVPDSANPPHRPVDQSSSVKVYTFTSIEQHFPVRLGVLGSPGRRKISTDYLLSARQCGKNVCVHNDPHPLGGN